MAAGKFKSKKEFVEVINKLFTIMSTDPKMGPKLAAARVPQRWEFSDFGLVLNATYADPKTAKKGHFLRWVWGDKECDWEAEVEMKMKSDVANKYFQGKENVPLAIALGRIRARGSVPKALKLIPITKPVYELYREMLEDEGYDHLLV
ncbi:MAG: hypothetical protein C4532_06515 [Candidatus Abyssobacteria bacterium SURF_17]|uniref:SCP2 domain-containing protein n=1 Tax=Candidatus Abyssobacteria bacterium SURF_17 TaxID=2093361 RepID=A0A419F1Q0_9BACT|nr:MAG: hypothetical protein C4532_06515 [Candidatus Abyssubacteria bacterium SURF_17]